MKAIVLTGKEKLELQEKQVPKPEENQVLIKTEVCGLCAYDLSFYHGHAPSYPMVLGHEPVGIVVEVGKKVKSLKKGDRVTGCGDSSFAEYTLLSCDRAAKVPEDITDAALWISEPLTCVVMGLRYSGIEVGDSVVVLGTGYMGLLWIQVLSSKQLSKLIAIDLRDKRLKLAKEFGADLTMNASESDVLRAVRELFPQGVNVVIEATGAKGVLNFATDILSNQGILGLFGWRFGEEPLPIGKIMDKGIEVKVLGPSTSRNQIKDFYSAVSLLERGTFNQTKLTTHRFDMQEAEKAFQLATEKPRTFIKSVLLCP